MRFVQRDRLYNMVGGYPVTYLWKFREPSSGGAKHDDAETEMIIDAKQSAGAKQTHSFREDQRLIYEPDGIRDGTRASLPFVRAWPEWYKAESALPEPPTHHNVKKIEDPIRGIE